MSREPHGTAHDVTSTATPDYAPVASEDGFSLLLVLCEEDWVVDPE